MPGIVGPIDASAGAITRANRIGVSKGTSSSRGVRALSANRRRVRVANAAGAPVVKPRRTATGGAVTVETDMSAPFQGSGSGGERVAGEAQVDVVEGRWSGAGRGGRQADLACGGEHVLRGHAAHRDGQRRPDGERVLVGD